MEVAVGMRRIDRKERYETEPPGLEEKRRPGNTEQADERIAEVAEIRPRLLSHRRASVTVFSIHHLSVFLVFCPWTSMKHTGITNTVGSRIYRSRNLAAGYTTICPCSPYLLRTLSRQIKDQIEDIEREPGLHRPVSAQPTQLKTGDAFPAEQAEGEQAPEIQRGPCPLVFRKI